MIVLHHPIVLYIVDAVRSVSVLLLLRDTAAYSDELCTLISARKN